MSPEGDGSRRSAYARDSPSDYRRRGNERDDLSRYDRPRRSRSRSPTRYDRDRERRRNRSRSRDEGRERGLERARSKSRSPLPKRRRLSRGSLSRSRSRSRDADRRRRRRSISSHSVSSEDSERRRRRKRKEKESKRSKSEERERRERKERKRERKEKKKSKNKAQWGRFGIITDTDMFTKAQEFHTWLVEERKINPETMSKDQNRKEFAKYMEDYNTATLPDEKYYNMEAYNRRMSALRQGDFVPPPEDTYDAEADMKALSGAHKKKHVDQDLHLNREQLMELRKVQNERVQVGKMKQLGMDIKQNMGVRMDGSTFDD